MIEALRVVGQVLLALVGVLVPVSIALGIYFAWRAIDRRKPGLPFKIFFWTSFAGICVWFLAGLAPVVVRAVPSWHEPLHRRGDPAAQLTVAAEGTRFDRVQIPITSGRDFLLLFENRDSGVLHDFDIIEHVLGEHGGERLEFDSDPFEGPHTREYPLRIQDFDEERETYSFRCSVHPRTMTGTVVIAVGSVEPRADFVTSLARGLSTSVHATEAGWQTAFDYFFGLLGLVLAAMLAKMRPLDRVARWFSVAMVYTAATTNLQSHASLAVLDDALLDFVSFFHDVVFHPLAGMAYIYALLLFPEGRLIPHLRHEVGRIAIGAASAFAITVALAAAGFIDPQAGVGHAVAFLKFFGVLIPVVGIAAQTFKVRRRADTPERRQQSRLLLWSLVPALLAGIAFLVADAVRGGPALERYVFRVSQPVFALIPIALAIGILRYRLWDIDVVVSKALVFGSLAAFIVAVYVAVVVGIGDLLGGENSAALSILATAIVAVAFQPVRDRLRRLANRLVYGERATPYEVMAGLSRQMSGALSVDEVLPGMAEAAARGVRAVRARARVLLADGSERAVAWPPGSEGGAFERTLPVVHQGERVGEIAVAKAPGDPFTVEEERLLDALASQAGLALRNVRLAEELRARLEEISAQAAELAVSRARLVTARIAEQRRLEREISDRVSRQIVSIGETLAEAEGALAAEPARGLALLDRVKAGASESLDTLRELAHGIFPPVLTDRGLVPALEALVARAGEGVALDALKGPRFDPPAEAAVYFCCREALANALRFAPGSAVTVRVEADEGWVSFSVRDDGPGFDVAALPADNPLHLLVDRVAALGGELSIESAPGLGTTVSGRVPAEPARARLTSL